METTTPATAAGAVLGALSGVVGRVRHAKPLHPTGVVLTGRLHRHGASSGASWIDSAGDDDVLVRLSRGGGLPAWLPDVHGLALRVPDGDRLADVLLSTTGSAPGLRHVLAPHLDVSAGTYTSLLPYRGPHGPLLLGARAVRRTPVGADPADVVQALRREPLRLRLGWATLTGPWRVFARLDLDGPAEAALDPPVHFDPLTPPTGLGTYPWAAALRAAAYARARDVVGPDGVHATHTADHPAARHHRAGSHASHTSHTSHAGDAGHAGNEGDHHERAA